jgi:uncharacterized membrane protein (DUF485 family)
MHDEALMALAKRRWRVSLTLTIALLVVYFGFLLLVAFNKTLLASLVVPGLSLGILGGAVVIVFAWLLTGYYVHWANRHYDPEVARLRGIEEGQP